MHCKHYCSPLSHLIHRQHPALTQPSQSSAENDRLWLWLVECCRLVESDEARVEQCEHVVGPAKAAEAAAVAAAVAAAAATVAAAAAGSAARPKSGACATPSATVCLVRGGALC